MHTSYFYRREQDDPKIAENTVLEKIGQKHNKTVAQVGCKSHLCWASLQLPICEALSNQTYKSAIVVRSNIWKSRYQIYEFSKRNNNLMLTNILTSQTRTAGSVSYLVLFTHFR